MHRQLYVARGGVVPAAGNGGARIGTGRGGGKRAERRRHRARWAAANDADFRAAPSYAYQETIRNDDGTKTYDVTMVLGSPYKRLMAVGGKPLSDADRRSEDEKLAQERRKRA